MAQKTTPVSLVPLVGLNSGQTFIVEDGGKFNRIPVFDISESAASAANAPYESRSAMEAASVLAPLLRTGYSASGGRVLFFKYDPLGTALTTADGRTWSPDSVSTPEHYGDVINTAMPLWAADLSGREGALEAGRTYAVTAKLAFPRRNFTLHGNGAELDYSARANADGDVAGSLLSISGIPFAPVAIASITTAADAFGQITTTVTTTGAHGQIVGDECMLSSDDVIDIGHDPVNETRGQFVRVETVISTTKFTTNQNIYEALVTNPTLMPIDWAENIHITGALRIKGPGRRPTAAGFLGLSFTFARDCSIGGLSTDGVDYQAFVRDNCLRVNAGVLTFKFGVKGASEAVQYGDTYKNASTDCHTAGILGYGGKHLFDWTRNTTPGIGRHCTIGPIIGYDTWDAMAATHGNSRDLTFTTMAGYNCKYVFGNRVAGVRVEDIYGENCSEVLKLTDDARDMSVDTVRGKNVTYVVRAKDPTWIGTLESRNIKIGRVEGENVSGTTVSLDWSDIPAFTQADAAVTGGSSNTITMGDFPVAMYNNSGALTGSEITMDWDGGGAGTAQTRQITGHNYSGGVNTITVSSWTNAPVAGTSSYVIRSFVDDVNIGKVISKNCVGADVFVAGNLRRLVVGDMDVVSTSISANPAVLVQGTANTHPDTIRFGKLRNFQKGVAAVSGFATDVTFEIDAAADTVLKAGSTMTGPLLLNAAPTAALGAATKAYVDSLTMPFATRAAAISGNTGTAQRITVAGIPYSYDATGTALTTADGRKWSPDRVAGLYPVAAWGEDLAAAWAWSKQLRGTSGQLYTLTAPLVATDPSVVDLQFGQSEVFFNFGDTEGMKIIYSPIGEQALTSSLLAGAPAITVPDGSIFASGNVLKVASNQTLPDNPDGSGQRGEFIRIQSIAANVLTLTAPLRFAYDHTLGGRMARIGGGKHDIHIGTARRPVGVAATYAMIEVEGSQGGDLRIENVTYNNGECVREVSCYGHRTTLLGVKAGLEVGTYGLVRTNSEMCEGTVEMSGGRHAVDHIAQAAGSTGGTSVWRHGHSAYNTARDCKTYGMLAAAYATHHGTYKNRFVDCDDVGSAGLVSFRGIGNRFVRGSQDDGVGAGAFGSLQQSGMGSSITDDNEAIGTVIRNLNANIVTQATAAAGLITLRNCDVHVRSTASVTRLGDLTGRGLRIIGGRYRIETIGTLSSRVFTLGSAVTLFEVSGGAVFDFRGSDMASGGGGVRLAQQANTGHATVMIADDVSVITDGVTLNRLSALIESNGGLVAGSRLGRINSRTGSGSGVSMTEVVKDTAITAYQSYITGVIEIDGTLRADVRRHFTSIASAPTAVGLTAVVAGVGYFSVGTASATDWVRITNAT